jgi:hypothetical protein
MAHRSLAASAGAGAGMRAFSWIASSIRPAA